MTPETITASEAESAPPPQGVDPETHPAAVLHLVVAGAFLAIGSLFALVAAIKLAEPGFLSGVAFLSYGRLVPMATNALLFGWLTIGLVGAAYFVVPRVSGVALRGGRLAMASVALMTVGFGAGLVGIALGFSEGRLYLEMPLFADAIALAGLIAAAVVITRTVAASPRRDSLLPPQWYFVAASWWLVLAVVIGNIPGIGGVNSAVQGAFFRASLTGLWFAAASVGIVYYLVPRLTGSRASTASQRVALGFWSLAFLWALTAPAELVYSASPDWLETLGVVFSMGLLIPVAVILSDIATMGRGRWVNVKDRTVFSFVIAGGFMFALLPIHNLVLALRSSSAILQFTAWVPAYEYLAFYGAFTFWLLALVYHAKPHLASASQVRRRLANAHLGFSVVGLLVMLSTMWISAAQVGLGWAGSANSDVDASEGFFNSVAPLASHYVWRAAGMAIFLVGQLVFAYNLFRQEAYVSHLAEEQGIDESEADAEESGEAPLAPVSMRTLTGRAALLFAIAALMVWVLPSLEAESGEATLVGDTIREYPSGSLQAEGRQVYVQEGCWYCHTQEVRPIVTDVGLGPVSQAGDFVHEVPYAHGVQRIGPDLTHVGAPDRFDSAESILRQLRFPRADDPWSNMPSYDYLSDRDLDALAAYLAGLD